MKLFREIRKALGIKNRYAVREIKEDGNIRAAVLLSSGERETLGSGNRKA
jgi:hypothetical protein